MVLTFIKRGIHPEFGAFEIGEEKDLNDFFETEKARRLEKELIRMKQAVAKTNYKKIKSKEE